MLRDVRPGGFSAASVSAIWHARCSVTRTEMLPLSETPKSPGRASPPSPLPHAVLSSWTLAGGGLWNF